MTEPTLEQLSAYLDHELDAAEQERVAEHIAGCADCQGRLDGLRQAAYAIRALPMETPPRTFTLPKRMPAERRWNWAPVGWIGGVAAAIVIVGFGLSHAHLGAGGSTASSSTNSGAGAALAAIPTNVEKRAAAPLNQDQYAAGASRALGLPNSTTVSDPTDPARSLTLAIDATSYAANGVVQLHVATTGLSSNQVASLRLFLIRDSASAGYAIRLAPPTNAQTSPYQFIAAYSIVQMQLQQPVAGNYHLQAEIQLSEGSALIASVPLTITP